jgi:protein-tyrosine phosphatase
MYPYPHRGAVPRETRQRVVPLTLDTMIDLHCHVLPGIDDGPSTIEGSLELARAAVAAGTRTIVATPHVSWRYRNDVREIRSLVERLNDRLAAEGIALDVRPGAEVAMTYAMEMTASELSALALGDGPWLLIECPLTTAASGFERILLNLQQDGHRILLAHPERCAAFQRDPELLASLVRAGLLTSITASAFSGRFGREARRFAYKLLHDELVHNVASDAHNVLGRPPTLAAELERAGLTPLGDWLTQAIPRAILDGSEIPPRPNVGLATAEPTLWSRLTRR